ncbi:MAG: esterase [Flavobacteriaceae bacterium]|nr:MAG: esterase [Flavobacteriaceae bacterium]
MIIKVVQWQIRIYVLVTIFTLSNVVLAAQKKIKISPYTIGSTYEKLKTAYPFIIPIEELNSEKIISNENVVYKIVDETSLKADVYRPKGNKDAVYPAVLLIHGGGWVSGSKENERVMAQQLAANGYVAITIAYRLSREAAYPAAVLDVKSAIRWMRIHAQEYRIDPDKITVLGASAGAQLATLVGVTPDHKIYTAQKQKVSDKVQAIVNIDGIVSFIHPDAKESQIAGLWLGGLQHENPKNWKEASPLEYVNMKTPPTLFINSAQERFHAGRDDMIAVLNQYHIYNEVHSLSESPHSFWLMHPWFNKTLEYIISFLDTVFKE